MRRRISSCERTFGSGFGSFGPRSPPNGFDGTFPSRERKRKNVRMEASLRRIVVARASSRANAMRKALASSGVTAAQSNGGCDSGPHRNAANCSRSISYPATVRSDVFRSASRNVRKRRTAKSPFTAVLVRSDVAHSLLSHLRGRRLLRPSPRSRVCRASKCRVGRACRPRR